MKSKFVLQNYAVAVNTCIENRRVFLTNKILVQILHVRCVKAISLKGVQTLLLSQMHTVFSGASMRGSQQYLTLVLLRLERWQWSK